MTRRLKETAAATSMPATAGNPEHRAHADFGTEIDVCGRRLFRALRGGSSSPAGVATASNPDGLRVPERIRGIYVPLRRRFAASITSSSISGGR
jgi:hypothetical protein